jgi:hypothetical protein
MTSNLFSPILHNMWKFPSRKKDKQDKSLAFFHGEAATSSIENAGSAYQAPSILAAGADASSVALLSAVTNIVLSFLLVKVPSLAEGRHSLRKTTMTIAIINTVTWLPIVILLLLFNKLNTFLLIGFWVVNLVPSILVGPLRDNWMSNLIPSETTGRYLGWRSAIASAFYLGTFYLMGFILDSTKSGGYINYAIITAFALFASLASCIFYSKINQPRLKTSAGKKDSFGFFTFLKQTRYNHLGTFVIFISLFSFAVNLSGPLVVAYMINNLHFSYMTYTAIISCEYIARIVSLSFWGKMIDRSGSLTLMMKVAHLIPFVPILWIFSSNIFYLGAVQMFSGIVWAAFDLCAQAFMFKATPPEQRLRYISYQRSLTTFSVAIGALTGAFLLNNIFPIFGSQILGVFLVSGVLRMVVIRVMLPRLQPGAIPEAVIHEELAAEFEKLKVEKPEGLYYHPEKWALFAKPVAVFGTIIGKAVNKISTPRPEGLYYNPQQWASYTGYSPFSTVNDKKSKSGLYYQKQTWAEYKKQPANNQAFTSGTNHSVKTAREGLFNNPAAQVKYLNKLAGTGVKSANNAKADRKGLFYNPQGWTTYLKQSMVLNATTARNGSEGFSVRQPVFYHPEVWERYMSKTPSSRAYITRSNIIPVRQPLYQPERWNKSIDPAVVRIGRKSTIGTSLVRQSSFKKLENRELPLRLLPAVKSTKTIRHTLMYPTTA